MKRRDLIAAGLGLAACLTVPALAVADDGWTMRISHVFPPSHPLAKLADVYAQAVTKETGGRVKVEMLGGGQAFAEKESYPAVAKGQIEATVLVSVQFSGIVPAVDALAIPFVLQSKNAAADFLGSPARKTLDEQVRARRVEPLAWMLQTRTSIFTSGSKPLATIADFAGIKIRGLNKVVDASFSAVGASPLATPGSEVYQALQSGLLDAALTDVSAALARRYYEVQKFGTIADNHIMAYGVVLANQDWVAKLPADVRAGLARASATAEAAGLADAEANRNAAIEGLKAKGMTLKILDQAEAATWSKALTAPSKAVYLERAGDAGKAVLGAFEKIGH